MLSPSLKKNEDLIVKYELKKEKLKKKIAFTSRIRDNFRRKFPVLPLAYRTFP